MEEIFDITEKGLMEMKLHQRYKILNGDYVITRVIGGWIYERREPQVNILLCTFVPEPIEKNKGGW